MSDGEVREAHMMEEFPNGLCTKCGMNIMKINGKKACPNCSTRAEKPSGLVNNLGDPGHDAFVSGHIDTMAKENMEIPKEEQYPIDIVEVPVSQLKKLTGATVGNYIANLDLVYSFLHNQPVNSIVHAKHLLKLKKKVLNLKNEIQIFLEGGN